MSDCSHFPIHQGTVPVFSVNRRFRLMGFRGKIDYSDVWKQAWPHTREQNTRDNNSWP